jgi:methanogenic corrinoid protein MtbC1
MTNVLSPKELALAIGASESSLKRWVDSGLLKASRTVGGHRRIELAEAVRFIREAKLVVVRPDVLGLSDLVELEHRRTDIGSNCIDTLQGALVAGDAALARAIIVSMFLNGRSIAEICDGALREVMGRVGEFWRHADDGIFIEHRASDIAIQSLNTLRMLVETPTADAPVAIGGAPAGDPYLLPSLMAATTLAAAGFREVNLGPNTPLESLARAVDHFKARLVWLSVSHVTDAPELERELARFGAQLADRKVTFIIGGRALDSSKIRAHPSMHRASSMQDLVSIASRAIPDAAAHPNGSGDTDGKQHGGVARRAGVVRKSEV